MNSVPGGGGKKKKGWKEILPLGNNSKTEVGTRGFQWNIGKE